MGDLILTVMLVIYGLLLAVWAGLGVQRLWWWYEDRYFDKLMKRLGGER